MTRSLKKNRTPVVKATKKTHSSASIEEPAPLHYTSIFLCCAVFLDTVVTMSSLPASTLHMSTAAFTIQTVIIYQLLFFLPQLGTTLLAERLGKHIGGTRAFAATLFATAASTFVTAKALREESTPLYFAARFLFGVLRHAILFGEMAWNDLPGNNNKEGMRMAKLFGLPVAMLIGGIMGDLTPHISVVVEIMGFVELAIAVLVGVLSLTRTKRPKTLPLVQSAAAYKNWLLRQPYRRFAAFLPMAFLVLSASFVQCMYPYNDRLEYHLSFTLIGVHMAAVVGLPLLVPHIVKWYGSTGQKRLIRQCVILFAMGAWFSDWAVHQKDVRIHILVTFFLTDVPNFILCAVFSTIISEAFTLGERPFALKAIFHVQLLIKLWVTALLGMSKMFFESYGRVDGPRLIAFSTALGVVGFGQFRSVPVSVATVIGAFALLASLPPLDDENIWGSAMEYYRSYINAII